MAKSKAQIAQQESGLEELRGLLNKGDTLYTILRHVSSSGMSRVISVVKVDVDGSLISLDWLIAKAGLFSRTPSSSRHDGLKVGGTGMDMGFHVVYNVSQAVLNDGYAITQRWL